MWKFLLAMVLSSGAAAAQDLPALYDVTGVADSDVLNARENPRATAQIVGALPPNTTGVEVTARSESGGWARINVGERTGWVSLDFLSPQPVAGDDPFAGPLRCFGTEPFWNIAFDAETTATLTRPGTAPVVFGSGATSASATTRALIATGPAGRLTAMLRRAECSDGMSDLLYGLSIDALTELGGELGGGGEVLTGCCTLAAQ